MSDVGYITYETSTGRITRWGACPDRLLNSQAGANESTLVDPIGHSEELICDTHMIESNAVVPRPLLTFDKIQIAADGVDKATLSNLPTPCVVMVDGVPHTITDGTLELTSDMEAIYKIEIEDPFPYQPFSVEIVASAVEPQ